jgi:hypothetical protein
MPELSAVSPSNFADSQPAGPAGARSLRTWPGGGNMHFGRGTKPAWCTHTRDLCGISGVHICTFRHHEVSAHGSVQAMFNHEFVFQKLIIGTSTTVVGFIGLAFRAFSTVHWSCGGTSDVTGPRDRSVLKVFNFCARNFRTRCSP